MKWLIFVVFILVGGCFRKSVDSRLEKSNVVKQSVTQTTQKISRPHFSSVRSRKFSKGEALYIKYCADCHGWEGRGDGQASFLMDVPTPILLRHDLLNDKSENEFADWVISGKALKLPLSDDSVPQKDSEIQALLAYIKKLPTFEWSKIESGQKVYDELCVSCHGLYGRGDGSLTAKMPGPLPDFSSSDFQTQHSDEELQQIISEGKDSMPGTADILNPNEILNTIEYIRVLSPGYENYDRFCLSCHGPKGTPINIFSINENEADYKYGNIDMPKFDNAYFQTHRSTINT